MEILETITKEVSELTEKACREQLVRYKQAIFFITGRLHGPFEFGSIRSSTNSDTFDNEPESIKALNIKLKAISEFSVDLAKIIDEYEVGYVNNILQKPLDQKKNLIGWSKYFRDRGQEELADFILKYTKNNQNK